MKIKLFLIIAVPLLLMPASALALSPWSDGLVPWLVQCGDTPETICTLKDAFATAARLINLLITASGIVASGTVIYAGWQMLQASLTGEAAGYEAGKKRLIAMAIGMAVIFAAYVVVNSIMVWIVGIDFKEINF